MYSVFSNGKDVRTGVSLSEACAVMAEEFHRNFKFKVVEVREVRKEKRLNEGGSSTEVYVERPVISVRGRPLTDRTMRAVA